MSKNKICLIVSSLHMGGAERVMSSLANDFSNKGYAVTLYILDASNIHYNLDDRVRLVDLGFWGRGSKVKKIIMIFRAFLKFRSDVKKVEPSFVLSFTDQVNVFAILSLLGAKIKVFISHRSRFDHFASPVYSVLTRLFYRFSHGCIYQTNEAMHVLSQSHKTKNNIVIPNPVNLEIVSFSDKKRIVIFSGRLIKSKGVLDVINGISMKDLSGWEFHIYGDGPEKHKLESIVLEKQLQNKILFPGKVRDIHARLKDSSIFVFPSYSEGFPNSLLEAMSCGNACVSYDCKSGPKDLITNGVNGYLVETGNVKLFMEKLEVLVKDADIRYLISRNAYESSRKYSAEIIGDRFIDFCQSS